MASRRARAGRGSSEDGAVLVEFSIVFLLFAVLLSGLIQYGVIFAAEQSLAHGAAEATRAVVNITDEDGDGSTEDEAADRIEEVLAQQLSWMDGSIVAADSQKVDYEVDFSTCATCVEVRVTYDWADDALVPELIPIGTPTLLRSSANVEYQ